MNACIYAVLNKRIYESGSNCKNEKCEVNVLDLCNKCLGRQVHKKTATLPKSIIQSSFEKNKISKISDIQ